MQARDKSYLPLPKEKAVLDHPDNYYTDIMQKYLARRNELPNYGDIVAAMQLTEDEELKFERYMNVHARVMRVPVYVLGILCDFDDIIRYRREGAAYIHHMTMNPFYLRDIQPAFEVCKDIDRLIDKVNRKRGLAKQLPIVSEPLPSGSPIMMPKMDEGWMQQNGYDALHLGVLEGELDYLEWLFERNPARDLNVKTSLGDTAANIAAQAGLFDKVACLANKGADLTIANDRKRNAIYFLSKAVRENKPGYLLAANILEKYAGMKFKIQMEMFPAAKSEENAAESDLKLGMIVL